jgi:hypothetical protein
MSAVEAEREQKNQIIDGRIQARYEQLSGGYSIEGEKLARIRALPLDYLQKLAEKLEHAKPGSTVYSQRASYIIDSVLSEYSVACWANEQANVD